MLRHVLLLLPDLLLGNRRLLLLVVVGIMRVRLLLLVHVLVYVGYVSVISPVVNASTKTLRHGRAGAKYKQNKLGSQRDTSNTGPSRPSSLPITPTIQGWLRVDNLGPRYLPIQHPNTEQQRSTTKDSTDE